jgi:DNA-3-methyladenine glycosylase I
VRDDELLFEMLTLSGVQVGADWTSILKRRHVYRFENRATQSILCC